MPLGRKAQDEWPDLRTPVLIVGAGPVGLLSTILLARYGIRSTIVEKHATRLGQPKSHVTNPRSMEMLRQAGLDSEALRKLGSSPEDMHLVQFVTSMAGVELGNIQYDTQGEDALVYTPEPLFHVAQPLLEDSLFESAVKTGMVTIWKDMDWRGCETVDGEIVSRVKHRKSGAELRWTSKYLLGCDGANATTRELLSISFVDEQKTGAGSFHFVSIQFNADLRRFKRGVLWWIFSLEQMGRTFICYDSGSNWVYCISYDPAKQPKETFTEEYCRKQIDEAIGEKVDYDILSTTHWSCSARAAASYRSPKHPNAFLVGDAAHAFPPTGGLGINTGFADAHNLVWKIFAVEQGWAESCILDTYTAERRPVAVSNGNFSAANWIKMLGLTQALYGPDMLNPEDPKLRMGNEVTRQAIADAIKDNFDHFNSVNLQLGYIYGKDARPDVQASVYTPAFEAGSRLPHAWVDVRGTTCSSLDLIDGKSFVVFASPDFTATRGPWLSVGKKDVLVRVYRLGIDFTCKDAEWEQLSGLNGCGAAWLVRPDQHILKSVRGVGGVEQSLLDYLQPHVSL